MALDWDEAFKRSVQQRRTEKLSIMMCDMEKCALKQKDLLQRLLFEDHKDTRNWWEYVSFVKAMEPQKGIAQLQRLVNRAISCIPEDVSTLNNRQYVALHLLSVELRCDSSNWEGASKYFKDTIWRKEVGRKYAHVFMAWADIEEKLKGPEGAADVIMKGISCDAAPKTTLLDRYATLNSKSTSNLTQSTTEQPDNTFDSKGKTLDSSISSLDGDDEAKTVKLDIQPTVTKVTPAAALREAFTPKQSSATAQATLIQRSGLR